MRFVLEGFIDYDSTVIHAVEPFNASTLYPIELASGNTAGTVALDLFAAGVRRVSLVDPEVVIPRGEQWLSWLALLGQLSALGIVVDWHLRSAADIPDVSHVLHLPPPRDVASGTAPEHLAEWMRVWQLFLLTERRGPNFLKVHDKRRFPSARYVIEGEEVAVADRFRMPSPVDLSDEIQRSFVEAGLLLVEETLGLWLPLAMPRWPIVARDIYVSVAEKQ